MVSLFLFERPAGPIIINLTDLEMTENCSASWQVLLNSLQVVSAMRGNPILVSLTMITNKVNPILTVLFPNSYFRSDEVETW